MGWTAERVELLKKLWAEGLSASQIAARLGEVTRNAVIGKVHRLGLAGRAGPQFRMSSHGLPRGPRSAYVRRSPAPALPRPAVQALSAEKPAVARACVVNPLAVSVVIDLSRAPLGILDLADGECRWPGSAAWCRAHADGSYCDHHHAIAYRPAARRGRR